MNILFFLTPKSDVAYIEDSFSLRQILEKMEIHRYSAIPILSNTGEYVGTITEGDILWYCKRNSMNALKTAESIFLNDIPKKFEYASVSISSNMEDLIARAMVQNFVPVVDDQNKFIGIVTRKDIIGYCYKMPPSRWSSCSRAPAPMLRTTSAWIRTSWWSLRCSPPPAPS